jgi:hypothetical protein
MLCISEQLRRLQRRQRCERVALAVNENSPLRANRGLLIELAAMRLGRRVQRVAVRVEMHYEARPGLLESLVTAAQVDSQKRVVRPIVDKNHQLIGHFIPVCVDG